MLIGFQDDPAFRWRADRADVLVRVAKAHATIVRATANWSQIASTEPRKAADSFDPAYRFEDIDELVRNAQMNGLTVMLTIWGTPGWANGGKAPNYAPDRMSDLHDFARAIADRYSGRHPGLPFVGHYTVWNEPNSGTFLAPTFSPDGSPVAPRVYALMARAAYYGIKAANPMAEVAVGQTSSRGHARPGRGPSLSPGGFARLLAQVDPDLPFDAWAHHPYSDVGHGPSEPYRFPNVNLRTLHTFEKKLDKWFGRSDIPIWISEYACETRPGKRGGVTLAQQAAYAREALEIAASDPRVEMFIWFTFRDDPQMETWDSGLIGPGDRRKPAYSAFAAAAARLDARNPVVGVRPGISHPRIRVPVWELAVRGGAGAVIGAWVSVWSQGKLIGRSTPATRIGRDGYAVFRLPIRNVRPGARYGVFLRGINDIHGNRISRRATLIGLRPVPAPRLS
jgi:Cellulase (glycosyl hydrolase family 5)